MAYLNNIENIRSVQWGAKYLWDIRFPDLNISGLNIKGAPHPFNTWFPASDVSEDIGNVNTYDFETPQSSFKIAKNSSSLQVRVTFFDDEKNTLLNWLDTWVNKDIFNRDKNEGNYVSTLDK